MADTQLVCQIIRYGFMHLHQIAILHVIRFFICLPIQIDNTVFYFKRLSGKSHTPLYIVLATVYGAGNHFAISTGILIDIFTACLIIIIKHHPLLFGSHSGHIHRFSQFFTGLIAHTINIIIGHICHHRISGREIKHHNIIQLHIPQTFYTLIVPLRKFQIRLAIENRQCMLCQRHVQRSLRYAGTITQLADKQIITHQ